MATLRSAFGTVLSTVEATVDSLNVIPTLLNHGTSRLNEYIVRDAAEKVLRDKRHENYMQAELGRIENEHLNEMLTIDQNRLKYEEKRKAFELLKTSNTLI